jgi:hypothetical protein
VAAAGHPQARAIFTRAGLSEEEVEKFTIAMGFAQLGSLGASMSGEAARNIEQGPPVVRANVAFLKTHEAALKTLGADMKALQAIQEGKTEAAVAAEAGLGFRVTGSMRAGLNSEIELEEIIRQVQDWAIEDLVADPMSELMHLRVRNTADGTAYVGLETVNDAGLVVAAISQQLRVQEAANRPLTAFCACELRSPSPFSEGGFKAFNEAYVEVLRGWGIVDGETNPVARSNVCPELAPPPEPLDEMADGAFRAARVFDVMDDVGMALVQPVVRMQTIALLGHCQGHQTGVRSGQAAEHGLRLARGHQHLPDRADDPEVGLSIQPCESV